MQNLQWTRSSTSPEDFQDFGDVQIIEDDPRTNYVDWEKI